MAVAGWLQAGEFGCKLVRSVHIGSYMAVLVEFCTTSIQATENERFFSIFYRFAAAWHPAMHRTEWTRGLLYLYRSIHVVTYMNRKQQNKNRLLFSIYGCLRFWSGKARFYR